MPKSRDSRKLSTWQYTAGTTLEIVAAPNSRITACSKDSNP